MKGTVIVSTTNNPSYRYYLPIVEWAWNQLGWNLHCIRPSDLSIENYREETVAQISRLYAACENLESGHMIMTSDIDMIPLSDYWNPNLYEITTYGHDLTNFGHVPICYIAMSDENWRKVMNLKKGSRMKGNIIRDLDSMPNASSNEKDKWWCVDQDLITERLKNYNVTKIHRGSRDDGLPVGRICRSSSFMPLQNTWIDFHAYREVFDPNVQQKIKSILQHAFGKVPEWLDEYNSNFK